MINPIDLFLIGFRYLPRTIKAEITLEAGERVRDAFMTGQPIVLDGRAGTWIITRMETALEVGRDDPVITVWGHPYEPEMYEFGL